MTAILRRGPLVLMLSLLGGMLVACDLTDLTLTGVNACNGSPEQARVRVQVGHTNEESVLGPGECTISFTGASDADHQVAYSVQASGAASYVAKIQERRAEVLQAMDAGGGDANQVTELWNKLLTLNGQLATVGTDTAGTACGGRIGEGSAAKVTISMAGGKWNCGGVVIQTPEPTTAPAAP